MEGGSGVESQTRRQLWRRRGDTVQPGHEPGDRRAESRLPLTRLRFSYLDGTRQSAAWQCGTARRDPDDAQGVFHRALRRAEVDSGIWWFGWSDPAVGDHTNLSRIARWIAAFAFVSGFIAPHGR